MHILPSLAWAALLASAGASLPLQAQEPASSSVSVPAGSASAESGVTGLDSLVRLALGVNPTLRAAESRTRAADAAVHHAGARPDLMLMLGVMNLPLGSPGFSDQMTMKAVGVGQTFPFPGKLGSATRAARHEAVASRAQFEVVRWKTTQAVKSAYYDVALADALLALVTRNRDVLVTLLHTTEAGYRVGRAGQEDVLRARVETTRLAEEALTLRERRRSALARVNALLDRPSDTPLADPTLPAAVVRLATPDSAADVRFETADFGARAAGGRLPPVDSLQALAIAHSPMLAAHEARLAAQGARVDLARKSALPDFDLSLQYGQRDGLADMVSATVSVPIPLQKGRKQNQMVAEAEAELTAEEAEHHAMVNELRERVAMLHSELERDRTRLVLYAGSILPDGRATLAAATSGFSVGRTEFSSLLDAQATLFNVEAEYLRAFTEFATALAALEATVGTEILP
jgi:outer membrane protein, heavy metal efflux system